MLGAMVALGACGQSSTGTTGGSDGSAAVGDMAGAAGRDLASPADLALAGDGGDVGACAPTTLSSACGKTQSIVRTLARVGGGVGATVGELVLNLHHYRLGSGSMGGVSHWSTVSDPVTVAEGADTQVDLDMCAGGEMWSEENCQFWLWGFVDKNANGVLEKGEPAGHALINVSCHAAGPGCVPIVLDCLDGPSCIAFEDPAGVCQCDPSSCNSEIVTCQ